MRNAKWTGKLSAVVTAAALAATGLPAAPSLVRAEETVTATVALDDIQSEYTNVEVDTTGGFTLLSINGDGVYELTGKGSGVVVEVAESITATLRLNGATLDNSALTTGKNDASIYGNKGAALTLELAGDSAVIGNPENGELDDGIAMKKSTGTLTIRDSGTGNGSLTITGNGGDGIQYKNGTVVMQSGTLTMQEIGGDGIQAENVTITGGILNITTAYENASTQFYSSGNASVEGKNTIWEQNNGETKYERVNVDTGSHKGIKVGTKGKTENYLDGTESETTEASGTLTISGGTLNIDTTGVGLKANSVSTDGYAATASGVYIIGSPDDAISSNKDIYISGGSLNLSSSDDGISAAQTLSITGSADVRIETCYEGLEGGSIIVGSKDEKDGPIVVINSKDDGINAASKTLTYTYDSAENDDENYLKYSVRNKNNTCVFNSGSVTVQIDSANEKTVTLGGKTISYKASGDGIDCNGTLDIEGGEHFVFGQVAGDNSPIDTDDGFTLSKNAAVFTAGGQGMGKEAYPQSGDAVYVAFTKSGSATAVNAGSAGSQPGPNDGQEQPGDGQQPPDDGERPGPNDGQERPGPNDGQQPPDDGERPGPNDGQERPDDGQGGPGEQGGSFYAGQTVVISDGSNTLISQKLPYAASAIFYASSALQSGSTYTLTTEEGTSEDPEEGEENPGEEKPEEETPEEETPGEDEEKAKAIEQVENAAVCFTSAKAKKKKIKLTMETGAVEGAKYEIRYKKANGEWTAVETTDAAYVLKGLQRKKKYTLSVRLAKEIDGTSYYSPWSEEIVRKTK